jgi:hypothetical protein
VVQWRQDALHETTPDLKGGRISRLARPRCHSCCYPARQGKARQGKSYNTADATLVRRHSSCRYSRQQALSIHVSAGYSKPPAFSRADYCLYQCRLGCWWIVDVKYCVRAFLPACLRWAAGVFRVALPRAAKDEADQAMSTPSLRFAQVG